MNPIAEARAYTEYRRYFEEYLPQFRNQLLLEEARGLSCCFGFQIFGIEEMLWVLTLEDGLLVHIQQTADRPSCWFTSDATTFMEVVSGNLSAQEAFFSGQVDIDGDIELGLKLSMLLSPFFEQFPFRP